MYPAVLSFVWCSLAAVIHYVNTKVTTDMYTVVLSIPSSSWTAVIHHVNTQVTT